jgi:hypothetical protein
MINGLQEQIIESERHSVEYAREIGELISEQEEIQTESVYKY